MMPIHTFVYRKSPVLSILRYPPTLRSRSHKLQLNKRHLSTTTHRCSFIKTLFTSDVELDMILPYPEVKWDDFYRLEEFIGKVRVSMGIPELVVDKHGRMPPLIDSSSGPKTSLQPENISHLGLYGILLLKRYNGIALNTVWSSRLFETLSYHPKLAVNLLFHNLGGAVVQTLVDDESIKQQLLPGFASYETPVAVGLSEAGGSITDYLLTTSVLSNDNLSYCIDGSKLSVVGGSRSKFIILPTKNKSDLNVFLLDSNRKGIKLTDNSNNLIDSASFEFSDCLASLDSLLYTGNNPDKYSRILSVGRTWLSSVAVGLLKQLVHKFSIHAGVTQTPLGKLMENQLVQKSIGDVSAKVFALESVTYYMSLLLDDQPSQDWLLESLLSYSIACETIYECFPLLIKLMGSSGLNTDPEVTTCLQSLVSLTNLFGSPDQYKVHVSVEGTRYLGELRKYRYSPWKRFLDNVTMVVGLTPRLGLRDHIYGQEFHDNFKEDNLARNMEIGLWMCYEIADKLIDQSASELHERQVVLDQLATVASYSFAMVATATRASRNYECGHENADHGMRLGLEYCRQTSRRLETCLREMQGFRMESSYFDEVMYLGAEVMDKRYYFSPHPLAPDLMTYDKDEILPT